MWRFRCIGPWFSSSDLLGRLRLRRAAGRLRERAGDGPAREFDLEVVVAVAPGVAQQHVGRAGKSCRIGGLAAQRGLGLAVAPWLVGDAAEREASLLDGVAVEFESDRDRDQREG